MLTDDGLQMAQLMLTCPIECPSCKRCVTVAAFLSACSDFWPNVDAVRFTCPLCGEVTQARLESSRISLGYTYAAGGAHFCGMIDVQVDGLTVYRNGDELQAQLEGQTWTIP
jgi:predicted RNA-binding Zn-ribbon protein involved in translation (DUF1610 family)